MNYERIKRVEDIILATIMLIVFSPIMLITAILIKLTSPGPILADIPKRVGKGGKLFRLYKFRSMVPGSYLAIRTNPKLKKFFEQYKKGGYKLKDDPRVTPVGRFIRKYSIDEFPQAVNILKGEMSLIGPRPYFAEELKVQGDMHPGTKKLIKDALKVKPGITGYWQVSGRSDVNFDKRIAIDAMYAKNMSFMLDLEILLRTPWAMLSGRGAV